MKDLTLDFHSKNSPGFGKIFYSQSYILVILSMTLLSGRLTLAALASKIAISKSSILVVFKILNIYPVSLDLILYVDFISCIFSSAVLQISGAVMLFSSSYLLGNKRLNRFYILLLSFILSILLLVFSPNMFRLFIG